MQLFLDALDRDASEREAFLRQACSDDRLLRVEVDSLLANHDQRTILVKRTVAADGPSQSAATVGLSHAGWLPRLWNSVDRRGLAVALGALLLALALLALGYWLESGIERRLRNNLAGQLQATLDSNVAAVVNWLELQKLEMATWAGHPDVRQQFPIIGELAGANESAVDDPGRKAARQEIVDAVTPLVQRDDVRHVHGIDTTGLIIFSTNQQPPGRYYVSKQGATQIAPVFVGQTVLLPPLEGRTLVEEDLPSISQIPIILVGSPVRDANERIVGGLFASLESGQEFTRLLDLGRAGLHSDTYAFGPKGKLLSASRYENQLKKLGLIDDAKDATSVLKVELRDPGVDLTAGQAAKLPIHKCPPTKMAASATSGVDAIDLDGYRDYRGVKVVGAWTWLDDYGFGVATEIEYDEAYAVLHYVRRSFWVLLGLLTTSGLAAFVFALTAARLRREVGEARQLGQFTLGQLIGQGGMGKVYMAKHALLRRPTAVKVLDGAQADDASIARFEREVQVASSLTHPNTVEIYDYGRTVDGVFFYAMEYLPGLTLEQLVRSEGAIPPARVLHILRQMLGSLSEAHRLGLIHRDVKPANVMLCERGGVPDYVKVLDFGLAKDPSSHLAPHITQTGLISGTPLYIAPESIEDPENLTPRADIYAVGAVAFYLLTGKELFAAANKLEIFDCVMNKPRRRPSDLVPSGIPPALDELVYRAVAIDPAERPASAEDMLAAVEAIAIDHPWSEAEARRWWQQYEASQTRVAMEPAPLG